MNVSSKDTTKQEQVYGKQQSMCCGVFSSLELGLQLLDSDSRTMINEFLEICHLLLGKLNLCTSYNFTLFVD